MIRLSAEEFDKIPLEHLMTIVDEDDICMLPQTSTLASGVSEWVARDKNGHQVSIGFDWCVSCIDQEPHIQLSGKPRHNLQLIDNKGKEMELETVCLQRALRNTNWESYILQHISPEAQLPRH